MWTASAGEYFRRWVETIVEGEMLRRAPLEQQIVGFYIDLLKETVIDVIVYLSCTITGQVRLSSVVDCQDCSAVRRQGEFVKVGREVAAVR